MENIDKLISALYLARSNSREEMLSDLILTVLYSAGEPLNIDEITDLINDFFLLKPIRYEIQQCLEILVEKEKIKSNRINYSLTENSKSQIYNLIIKRRDSSKKRFTEFNQVVDELTDEKFQESEKQKLWDVFNEYLLECFMIFGKRAVNIFLPYKDDELPQENHIIENALKKLSTEKLRSTFNKLVVEYPDRLTEIELRHLSTLASRAEKFYSLGIKKEEYERINNLQIRNLIVLADTNILYTVLNLHVHQEQAAITEIVRLANEKIIDFRIVYLPKTYKELKKAKQSLENAISRERLTNRQIRAMLNSGKLDELATEYYKKKLLNSDYPHPADKILYASDILKRHGITVYNQKFPKLDGNEEYLNREISKYYEFQEYYNRMNEERGTGSRLHKDDFKIEHDIYLREVVKTLKEKFSKDVIKFVCLTIDRSLIHFDQYTIRKENQNLSGIVNPNFLMPSIFIKKIRPFLPMVTKNYRKAFIASLTAPSLAREDDTKREESVITQKSMNYFKSLGIDDEEVICSIIKRELFLEEFSQHEQENTAEDFIKSEVSKEIDKLQAKHLELEKQITTLKETAEARLEKQKQELQQAKDEKERAEIKKQSKIDKLLLTIKEKEALEEQLKKLKKEREKFSKEKSIETKTSLLEEVNQSIITLENTESILADIINKRSRNFKWRLSTIPIVYFMFIAFLIFKLTWEIMEPFTYLLSLLGIILSYLYLAISGESFSPIRYFEIKKAKIREQIYTSYNFDYKYLESQKKRKEKLEIEIAELSKQILT